MQSSRTDDELRHLRPSTVVTDERMLEEASQALTDGYESVARLKLESFLGLVKDEAEFLRRASERGLEDLAQVVLSGGKLSLEQAMFLKRPNSGQRCGTFADAVR